MNNDVRHRQELAALAALGALTPEQQEELSARVANDAITREDVQALSGVAERLAQSLPAVATPSRALKERILRQAERAKAQKQITAHVQGLVPVATEGLAFLLQANGADAGWVPLRVPGAFVKFLSMDPQNNYAMVLGKLEAGATYPGHVHCHPEDIYMLSGDLHVGDTVIRAGDFHHAEAASRHGVNWSESGCTLIAVLSKEDLLNQILPAS